MLPVGEVYWVIGRMVWLLIAVVVPAPSAAMVIGEVLDVERALSPGLVAARVWEAPMVRPRLSVWVTVVR